jgi:DNA-binding Lrp family transcriptional regulator
MKEGHMKTINKYKTLANANENFNRAEYDQALRNYALVLKDFPGSKEAYNGAILAEMAMSGEMSAVALFDYYAVLREEDAEEADSIMSEILASLDGTFEEISSLISDPIKNRIEAENGILYSDFITLVKENGDFKRTFENIMFSTRVIITEKEDFLDFLDKLVKHGFKEMALGYVESALSVYKNDTRLTEIFNAIDQEGAG